MHIVAGGPSESKCGQIPGITAEECDHPDIAVEDDHIEGQGPDQNAEVIGSKNAPDVDRTGQLAVIANLEHGYLCPDSVTDLLKGGAKVLRKVRSACSS